MSDIKKQNEELNLMNLLNSSIRTAGLSLDLTATAVVYKIVALFNEKKGSMSIDEIRNIVTSVVNDPKFAVLEKENKESK